jgi:hypothetical protein
LATVVNPLGSSEARGRVGGVIYSTWRGRRTVRTFTPPGHEDDPLRQAQKALVQAQGQRWSTISPPDRFAWNHYADTHPVIDWTGSPKRLAGYHWFVRCNSLLVRMNRPTIDSPPTWHVDFTLEPLGAAFTEDEYVVYWSLNTETPGRQCWVTIWHAQYSSPGRTPSLHDARWLKFTSWNSSITSTGIVTPAYHHFWLRIASDQGVTGTFHLCSAGPPA